MVWLIWTCPWSPPEEALMATRRSHWRKGALRVLSALALAVGASVAMAPAAQAATTGATFTKVSDWGTGFTGQYTVTNGGATAMSSWKVEFDLPAGTTVGSYWDALMTSSGSHYTFTNREYNGTVPP